VEWSWPWPITFPTVTQSSNRLLGKTQCQDLFDESAFRLGVGRSVGAKAVGEGSLEVCVGTGGFGVGTKVVAEDQMVRKLGIVGRADIEVMGRRAGRSGEGFAPGNTEVAFMAVTERVESGEDGGKVGPGGDHDVQIDDGLGWEPGNGCAADVFDPLGEGT
jgi:hypothetical protein